MEDHDPEQILNIRKDLRRLKVYTIDNAATSEIDDGISIEVLTSDADDNIDSSSKTSNSNQPNSNSNHNHIRQRYWIHIADADRWAPRGSTILQSAQRRATSIYLPTGSYSMFPTQMSSKAMSLNANFNSCALSLGVELNPDGSIDENSIVVTSSIVRVSYRLTYDDVDEMLEEGVGYNEEWQLGALLAAATKRRNYRSKNGSTEGIVSNPLPQGAVSVQFPITNTNTDSSSSSMTNSDISKQQPSQEVGKEEDSDPQDNAVISIHVESTHNAGVNASIIDSESGEVSPSSKYAAPVSPANLMVTEMMILAGEVSFKQFSLFNITNMNSFFHGILFVLLLFITFYICICRPWENGVL